MLGYIIIAVVNVAAVVVTLAVWRLWRWHRDGVRRAGIEGYLDGLRDRLRERPDGSDGNGSNVTRLAPRRS